MNIDPLHTLTSLPDRTTIRSCKNQQGVQGRHLYPVARLPLDIGFSENARQWWGYERGDGMQVLKPFTGMWQLEEAQDKGYIVRGPFVANSINEARTLLKRKLKEARDKRKGKVAERKVKAAEENQVFELEPA